MSANGVCARCGNCVDAFQREAAMCVVGGLILCAFVIGGVLVTNIITSMPVAFLLVLALFLALRKSSSLPPAASS